MNKMCAEQTRQMADSSFRLIGPHQQHVIVVTSSPALLHNYSTIPFPMSFTVFYSSCTVSGLVCSLCSPPPPARGPEYNFKL